MAKYWPQLSNFWEKCNFRDPSLVTFCLCIYLIKPFYFNRSAWNKLTHLLNLMKLKDSYFWIPTYLNFLVPQIPKMCDPILATLMKMQPHYCQSGRDSKCDRIQRHISLAYD